MATSKRDQLRQLQQAFDITVPVVKEKKDWKQICIDHLNFNPDLCPHCAKGMMVTIDVFRPGRAPPSFSHFIPQTEIENVSIHWKSSEQDMGLYCICPEYHPSSSIERTLNMLYPSWYIILHHTRLQSSLHWSFFFKLNFHSMILPKLLLRVEFYSTEASCWADATRSLIYYILWYCYFFNAWCFPGNQM